MWLAVGGALVGVLAVYLFVVEPVARAWEGLDRKIARKAQALKTDREILPFAKTIESDYQAFSVQGVAGTSEDEDASAMLATVESISRKDSCRIVNIKESGSGKDGAVSEIRMEVSVEGALDRCLQFLWDIESEKGMILKVRRYSLAAASGGKNVLKGTIFIVRIVLTSHAHIDKIRI